MTPADTTRRLYAINGGLPMTMKDALAAGLSRSSLRAAIHSGEIESLGYGVIALPTVSTTDDSQSYLRRLQAVAATHDDIVFSHDSAAFLHGIPQRERVPTRIHAYHCAPRRSPGLFRHRGRLDSAEVTERQGLRVTSAWRTACDIARGHSLSHGLMAIDHVMRQRVIEIAARSDLVVDRIVELESAVNIARAELSAYVQSARRRHGVARLRLAADEASPLAESPAESFSRGEFIAAGIPIPHQQFRVVDGNGTERRVDLLLADGLAGECDGLVKYDGPHGAEQLLREKRRDLALAAVGIDTIRWSAHQIFTDPGSVVRAIRQRLRSSTKPR